MTRSRRRWVAAALVAVVVVAAGVGIWLGTRGSPTPTGGLSPSARFEPSAGPSAQPPPKGEQFGVSVNRLFNDHLYNQQQINGQLAALRQTGATVARSDALWEASEPSPPSAGVHHYDWSFDDEIAGSLAANGLQWLPIIDYSASWAESIPGVDHSPPSLPADYAMYAAAFAQRYGQGGSFWQANPSLPAHPVTTFEIWNEPDNVSFWAPGSIAAGYIELYLAARDAILAVDPSARVIVGGLTKPAESLRAMLTARPDAVGHIDGIAIHPYAPVPEGTLGSVQGDRAALEALGLGGVPLYATEFGWTTRPPGAHGYIQGRVRPGYIEATFAGLGHLNCGVAAAILYTWITPERNPSDPEDWFGISPPGGGGSPDVQALAAGIRAASRPARTDDLCR